MSSHTFAYVSSIGSYTYLTRVMLMLSITILYMVSLNEYFVLSRPQLSDNDNYEQSNSQLHKDGDIRLVGGESEGTGNVLIYHEEEWGVICDDGWNLRSAHIICKSIGHPYALGYTNQAYFGIVRNHEIKLDDVRCYGDEPSILDCNSNYWGQHNCADNEAAGVFCAPTSLKELITGKAKKPSTYKPTNPTTTSTTTTTPTTQTTLTKSSTKAPTNYEDSYNYELGNIWDENDLSNEVYTHIKEEEEENALIKILPEPIESSPTLVEDNEIKSDVAEFQIAPVVAVDLEGNAVELDPVTASAEDFREVTEGDETNTEMLSNVTDQVLAEIFLKKKELQKEIDDSKAKENEFIHEKEETPVMNRDPHHPSPYDIRILNGRDETEGRVEVNIGGVWGIICSDNWNLLEARVACKQAGLGFAKMAAKGTYFGGLNLPKMIQGIKCDGTEDRLSDCYHERVGDVVCPERQYIAGVVCAFNLPDLVPNNTLLETSVYLQDAPLQYLQCAMEEGCAAPSAYDIIKRFPYSYHNHRRRLLRFSSSTWNYGTSDFRPFIPKSAWEWHNCHMHYHSMEVFATYDLLDQNHNRVADGHKASFCLEDVDCLPGTEKRYECVGYSDQGISVGCADTYLHSIDCQWIDITDLKVGKYIFRVHVNPQFKVAELDYENNAASCDLEYTGYTVEVKNCAIGRGDHLPHRD